MIDSYLEMLYWPEAEVRATAIARLQVEGKAAVAPLFDILAASDTQRIPAEWMTPEARAAALERAHQAAAETLAGMGEPFAHELTCRLLASRAISVQLDIEQVCRLVGEAAIDPLIELLTWNDEDTRSIPSRLKREHCVSQAALRDRTQKARGNVLRALATVESERVESYVHNCSDAYELANQREWREGGIIAALYGSLALIPIVSRVLNFESLLGSLLTVSVSGLMIAVTWSKVRKRKDETAQLMGGLSNPFLVGIVASYLNSKDKRLREAAKLDLMRILPRVREEHQGLLAPDEMNALLAELRQVKTYPESSEFALLVLNALHYVGTASALPHLRRVIADQNTIPSPVVLAAQECLARVEQRVEEAKQTDTLLRASSPAAAAPDTLLRAAQGTNWRAANEEENCQLLRPR